MPTVADNLSQIRMRMQQAASRVGRSSQSCRLVAVSKLKPLELMIEAYRAGQVIFGENYVQEGLRKLQGFEQLGLRELVEVHLTGPLQSNKIKDAVGSFAVIHSVHRVDIAEKIALQASRLGLRQKVLLQVNTSGEDSKSGFNLAELERSFGALKKLSDLEILGLMTIGEYVDPVAGREERVREFQFLRRIRDQLVMEFSAQLSDLSMGMSHDFELAIEEGATFVRVGSSIFGERV